MQYLLWLTGVADTQGRLLRIFYPTGYKLHINPLLDLLQNSGVGLYTGNVYCGAPTVADDLLFLSRSIVDLLAMLSAQGYFASLERYTKVFIVNSPLIRH